MPAPSQLSIATSSLLRLLKEESSYHKELKQQQQRIETLEQHPSENENAEFQLNQERRALDETKAVFPPLKQRIADAAAKLEQRLNESGDNFPVEEVTRAKAALEQAKALG